ncbi:MAG: response regulator [Sphingobacterium sp.]|nr:response regulator [Sphingobacterium sp.]
MEKKILICDTSRDLVQVLKAILSELTSANILPETSVSDAYEQIVRNRPDIFMVDLAMPNIKADKLMHDIRHEEGRTAIYIISLSATAEGMRLALAAGADVAMAKPLDLDELIGQVNRALQ